MYTYFILPYIPGGGATALCYKAELIRGLTMQEELGIPVGLVTTALSSAVDFGIGVRGEKG